jgi:hypothetical protein
MLRAAVPNSGIRKAASCTRSMPRPTSEFGLFRFRVSTQHTQAGNHLVNCGLSFCSASCLPGTCTCPDGPPEPRGEPPGQSSSYSSSSSIVRGCRALASYPTMTLRPRFQLALDQQPTRGQGRLAWRPAPLALAETAHTATILRIVSSSD